MSNSITYHLLVVGLENAVDAALVTAKLEEVPGVYYAHASAQAGRCVVDADGDTCDPTQLTTVLALAGYPAEVEY
ncbi:hypothetical protein GCM10022225_57350 [Plantactinospora mayteni]|uniref:HMA domain-containing protein n=1 Tax=Plantactinospora mayteni TaxID=566021 RepID=A0ABQ4F1S2_9ACTN|nr:hypothetical protein [Plantactinospora mayteni]GIH00861.1 hypothetical protein Pma05_74330 [Plantactinospora mayteni]